MFNDLFKIEVSSWNEHIADDLYDFNGKYDSFEYYSPFNGNYKEFYLCCGVNNSMIVAEEEKLKSIVKNNSKLLLGFQYDDNNSRFIVNTSNVYRMFFKTYNLERLYYLITKQEKICVGDVLKLGRIRLKIESVILKDNIKLEPDNILLIDKKKEVKFFKSKCRFCLSGLSSEENPLLSPCNCTGSIQTVHYLCLKQFLSSNLEKSQTEQTYYYTWKNDMCDLCLTRFPKKIKRIDSDKVYNLIEFDLPFESYIKFTYYSYNDQKKRFYSKGCIFVNLKDKLSLNHFEIKIGRTNESTIFLKESTVSRNHCSLKIFFMNDTYHMEVCPNQSKFGSLKYIPYNNFVVSDKLNETNDLFKTNSNLKWLNSINNSFILGKHLVSFKISHSTIKSFQNFFSNKLSCCLPVERKKADFIEFNKSKYIKENLQQTEDINDSSYIEVFKKQEKEENDFSTDKNIFIHENYNDEEEKEFFYNSKRFKILEYDSIEECELNIDSIIRNDLTSIIEDK